MCPLRLFWDRKAYLNALPINAVCPLITWQGMFVNALFNRFQVPFTHMAGHVFECNLLFNQFQVPFAHITGHISECTFQLISCALCSHYRAYFNQFHVTLLTLQGMFLNALFNKFSVPFAHVAWHIFECTLQFISCDFAHGEGHIFECTFQSISCYFAHIAGHIFECTLQFITCDFAHIAGRVFMPPTLKKLKGHIAFGSSVRPCVHPLQL